MKGDPFSVVGLQRSDQHRIQGARRGEFSLMADC